MSYFRSPDVLERRNNAAAVKKAMLAKFIAKAQDPALEQQRLKRIEIAEARSRRMAEREAERKVREAEIAAQAAREAEIAVQKQREADEIEALIAAEATERAAALAVNRKPSAMPATRRARPPRKSGGAATDRPRSPVLGRLGQANWHTAC